jgi:hypothetical protein
MNDNKKYVLLTPSARSAFDEIRGEYENALLEKASEIAKGYNTGDAEISLRDVVEAKERLYESGGDIHKLKRRERLASAALFGGFSYVLMGIFTFFIINIHRNKNLFSEEYIWLLFVIFGMVLMIIPLVYDFERLLLHRRSRNGENGYSKYVSLDTIVKMWSVIEQKCMDLMASRGINTDNSSSFLTAYDFLIHELNTREYIDNINTILKTRNDIVHNKDFDMKKEDVVHLLNLSQTIINELDKRIRDISDGKQA